MISVEYSEAIVEVLDILDNSDDTICKKIPDKLIEFWQRNKSSTYKPNLDHNKPLNEMELKEKTKDIITMIYLNYLCDENEKEITLNTLRKNEENYQLMIRKRYNPDNIFKNRKIEEAEIKKTTNTKSVIKYKKTIFVKIINSIKAFFRFYKNKR